MTENRDLIQGTPEWHEARRGKITGSRFRDVMSKKDGITRKAFLKGLLLERKTGFCRGGYFDKNMANGQNIEPHARAYYEGITGTKVEQVGFIDHLLEQYRGYVGSSPDGLIGTSGGLEIKCVIPKTHLDYIAKNVLPSTYLPQVQGNMWVTGREWWDFVSFCPEVKTEPYWCIRVERDQAYINKLAAAVDEFIQEMVELQKTQTEVDPQLLIDVTEGYSNENDWQLKLKDEIRGKVRHGVVCAMIKGKGGLVDLDDGTKGLVSLYVDFIMTGQ